MTTSHGNRPEQELRAALQELGLTELLAPGNEGVWRDLVESEAFLDWPLEPMERWVRAVREHAASIASPEFVEMWVLVGRQIDPDFVTALQKAAVAHGLSGRGAGRLPETLGEFWREPADSKALVGLHELIVLCLQARLQDVRGAEIASSAADDPLEPALEALRARFDEGVLFNDPEEPAGDLISATLDDYPELRDALGGPPPDP